jgi:hypothetical protein
MKRLIVALFLVSQTAYAFDDSPTKSFSTKENNHETMLITWKTVANIQQVCQAEYKRRGFGEITHRVDACSFWNDLTKTCTIYTKKNPTMHDVGHEMRHCYQGNWH